MSAFDKLVASLKRTPQPDPTVKAQVLALAKENFARAQETDVAGRQKDNQSQRAGILTRIYDMFASSLRPALYVTSSLVVVGVGLFATQDMWSPPTSPLKAPEIATQQVQDTSELLSPSPSLEMLQLDAASAADGMDVATHSTSQLAAPRARTEGVFSAAPAQQLQAVQPKSLIFPEPSTTDRFASEDDNPVKVTVEEPVSTFSIDVDTASYAIARRWLQSGSLPHKEAVRIEEFINAFDYAYQSPTEDVPFAVHTQLSTTPWNPDTQLLHVAIQGREGVERPPLDLVFLIDTSGSMQSPDKLPLLQKSFAMLLGALNPNDTVALVTYAGSSEIALEPTPVSERSTIDAALMRLTAGGGTAGATGLTTAYDLAAQGQGDGRLSRVILATDGDFNIGLSSPDAMEDFITARRDQGTSLSILGFGRGNLNDALMQALAQAGNGQAAYIDTALEAQRVLVDNVQSLVPIAGDVKIQIEFNPAQIAEYRLIGYETRALAREDFNNDRVDAGDIGAGHSVTALYELTPVGSPARLTEPLRYSVAEVPDSAETGYLRLRYKNPDDTASQLIEAVLPTEVSALDTEARFAVAMAGFGQLLRGTTALGDWSWSEALDFTEAAVTQNPTAHRSEALQLMRLAQTLSQ